MKSTLWAMLAASPFVVVVSLAACTSSSEEEPRVAAATRDASAPLRNDDSAEIPCEGRHVLQTICQRCHTRPMQNGAPFPLQYRSDILATYGEVVIRDLMIEQVTARRMPLAPVTIDDAERATLLAWLNAGAPASPPDTCADAGAAADAASDAEAATDAGVDSSDAADDALHDPGGGGHEDDSGVGE